MTIDITQYSPVAFVPSDAPQIASAFTALQTLLNGNLENEHIKTTAAIAISKLADYPADATKLLKGDATWAKLADADIAAGTIGLTKLTASAWTAHTATYTGWAATPTQACAYCQIGKQVTFRFNFSGTSTATTAAISLPVAPKAAIVCGYPCIGTDNGSLVSTPVMAYVSGAAAVEFFKTWALGGWTATGTKAVIGTIVYEAA